MLYTYYTIADSHIHGPNTKERNNITFHDVIHFCANNAATFLIYV